MARIAKLFVALLVIPVFAGTALAQDETDEASRSIRYKARTEIDFEGVDVTGELVKPSGQLLLDRKRANFNPLIRLREDFNTEMMQSIDEVK